METRQDLGKHEKMLIEQAERYGVLAAEMLKHTVVDRQDAALFALEKQGEVFCELLDPEQEAEANGKSKGIPPAANEADCRPRAAGGWGTLIHFIEFYNPAKDSYIPWHGIVIVETYDRKYLMDVKPLRPAKERAILVYKP